MPFQFYMSLVRQLSMFWNEFPCRVPAGCPDGAGCPPSLLCPPLTRRAKEVFQPPRPGAPTERSSAGCHALSRRVPAISSVPSFDPKGKGGLPTTQEPPSPFGMKEGTIGTRSWYQTPTAHSPSKQSKETQPPSKPEAQSPRHPRSRSSPPPKQPAPKPPRRASSFPSPGSFSPIIQPQHPKHRLLLFGAPLNPKGQCRSSHPTPSPRPPRTLGDICVQKRPPCDTIRPRYPCAPRHSP